MSETTQREKGERLRQLHSGPGILVLPNVWDVASARIVAGAGAAALATSSGAVAWVLGYPDGQRVSREEMLEMVRRIAASVPVPVTADLEAGYGAAPEAAAATARGALKAGAVGMNLEDGTGDPSHPLFSIPEQVERIRAARAAAEQAAIPFVLNARVDVYLAGIREEDPFEHAVRRAVAYREAGADSLFVPGVRDAATIGALARAIDGPLNILAGPGSPSIPELRALGVRRVSVGSGLARAALATTRRAAQELLGAGTYDALAEMLPHPEVNRLLA